eukprot:scaffold55189_cov15-Tisochrysis_lutea.AAC.2
MVFTAKVLDDLHSRPLCAMRPALVINLDVKDSHEEAALAAPHALQLCSLVSSSASMRFKPSLSLTMGFRPVYALK